MAAVVLFSSWRSSAASRGRRFQALASPSARLAALLRRGLADSSRRKPEPLKKRVRQGDAEVPTTGGLWDEDTLGSQFDETPPPVSLAEGLTNRQLKQSPPGHIRARKLFDTHELYDALEDEPKRKPKGMPRFNVRDFVPDDSLTKQEDIIQKIIREGRAEREELKQRKRRAIEKEKELRARVPAAIGSEDGDDQQPMQGSSTDDSVRSSERYSSTPASSSPAKVETLSPATAAQRATSVAHKAKPLVLDSPAIASMPANSTSNGEDGHLRSHSSKSASHSRTGSSMPLGGLTSEAPEPMRPTMMADWMGSLRKTAARSSASVGARSGNSGFVLDSDAEEALREASSAEDVLQVSLGLREPVPSQQALAALEAFDLKLTALERERGKYANDLRVRRLLQALGRNIGTLPPRRFSSTLSIVARLRASPAWLPELFGKGPSYFRAFDTRSLATTMTALAHLQESSPALRGHASVLCKALEAAIAARGIEELHKTPPLETVAFLRSFARLGITQAQLYMPLLHSLRNHVEARLLPLQDISACLAAASTAGIEEEVLWSVADDWQQRQEAGSISSSDMETLRRAASSPSRQQLPLSSDGPAAT